MFETMIGTAEKTDADIVMCRFTHCCFKPFLPAGEYNLKNAGDFKAVYTDFFTFNIPWNKLFKSGVVTGRFDESLRIFEDGLFVLEALQNSGKAVVITDELYYYYDAGKDNSTDKVSLVNAFLSGKFWKSKEGYWFKFNAIKPMFDKLLKSGGHNDAMLKYARSFDMAFWELVKLLDSGCPLEACSLEMAEIFRQPNFVLSLRARGWSFKFPTKKRIDEFLALCAVEYKNNTNPNAGAIYPAVVKHFYDNLVWRENEFEESFWEDTLPFAEIPLAL
jgi:hypothetical protein